MAETVARVIRRVAAQAEQAAETRVQVLQVRRVLSWQTATQVQVVAAVPVVVVLVVMGLPVVLEALTVQAAAVVAADLMAMRKAGMAPMVRKASSSSNTRQVATLPRPGRPTRTLYLPV